MSKFLPGTDPQVLEDVQRALRLKVRREARMQSARASASLHSDDPSSVRSEVVPTMPTESEVDFSPSIGLNNMHPVPTSTTEGATLDWGGPADEEKSDKRWSIHISMRRPKERSVSVSKELVEKQAMMYSGMYASGSILQVVTLY
jgi:hypothetical protein